MKININEIDLDISTSWTDTIHVLAEKSTILTPSINYDKHNFISLLMDTASHNNIFFPFQRYILHTFTYEQLGIPYGQDSVDYGDYYLATINPKIKSYDIQNNKMLLSNNP